MLSKAFLKRIWFLNFVRRIFYATKQYNYRYLQILKWGFQSNEDTNYTYDLSPANWNYLTSMLALVLGADYATIAAYMDEARQDEALRKHIIQGIKSSALGRFADTEVRFARRLGWYAAVRVLKPRLVVETGVDKGLGSVLLCSALLRNQAEGYEGRYIGTDINPKAGYLLSGVYATVGSIAYGDSIESLNKLTGTIDLFINDSDHSAEYEYQEYRTIQNRLTENSIILGDNAEGTSSLHTFSLETGRQFLFFQEVPENHWYPGCGIGFSFFRPVAPKSAG